MNRRVKVAVGVAAIAAAAYGAIYAKENFFVDLPEYPSIGKAVWLPQNWSPKDADWYHHADQGTVTFGVPYEWFTKLEQPTIPFPAIFSAAGRLADLSYHDRYGSSQATSPAATMNCPSASPAAQSIWSARLR